MSPWWKKTHLSVICGARREQRLQGVVTGDEEASKVDEELAGNVEKDKEEVDTDQAQDRIDLGDVGLALQVIQDGVLGELYTHRNRQQCNPCLADSCILCCFSLSAMQAQ